VLFNFIDAEPWASRVELDHLKSSIIRLGRDRTTNTVAIESLKSDSQAKGEKIITLEGERRILKDEMNDLEDRLMEISQSLTI
jgi:hypothetical protein